MSAPLAFPTPDPRAAAHRLLAEGHRLIGEGQARIAEGHEQLAALAERATQATVATELLTYDEAADALGMSATFVRRACRRGEIPLIRMSNRRRIRASDLEEYKARRVHGHGRRRQRGA